MHYTLGHGEEEAWSVSNMLDLNAWSIVCPRWRQFRKKLHQSFNRLLDPLLLTMYYLLFYYRILASHLFFCLLRPKQNVLIETFAICNFSSMYECMLLFFYILDLFLSLKCTVLWPTNSVTLWVHLIAIISQF